MNPSRLFLALLSLTFLAGCVVTGGVEYTDPKTGATASLGINKEFKPKARAEAKRVVPLEQ